MGPAELMSGQANAQNTQNHRKRRPPGGPQDQRPDRGDARSVALVEIRQVRAEEHQNAGRLVVAAYRALSGSHLSDEYAALLADVARRAAEAEVLVAIDGELVGCVTFVPDGSSPWAVPDRSRRSRRSRRQKQPLQRSRRR